MRCRTRFSIGTVLALLAMDGLIAVGAAAAAGDLDLSFGTSGWAAAPLPSTFAEAVAIQADGRIVVAGTARYHFAIARFMPDGSLDSSFGGGDGKLTTVFRSELPDGRSWAYDVAIQPDGKIVAAGVMRVSDRPGERMAVARYLPDGQLDPDFGDGDGMTRIKYGRLSRAQAVDILSDGTILLGGTGRGGPAFVLLTSDGVLDRTFGVNLGNYVPTGFALDRSAVVVAAYEFNPPHRFKVARLELDGVPDVTFGGDGIRRYAIGDYAFTTGIAVDANGRILVGVDTGGTTALARLQPDGAWDTSFSEDGLAEVPATFEYDYVDSVAVQNDGKIIVGGGAFAGAGSYEYHSLVARFGVDGTPDISFGEDGVVIQPGLGFMGFVRGCSDLALQPDGKIVIVTDEASAFVAARFHVT